MRKGTGKLSRIARRLILWGAIALGVIAILTALQRQLIYFPSTAPEATLLREAEALGITPWRDSGGSIIGWRGRPQGDGSRRVIAFHGNAGLALHRDYYIHGLESRGESWEVFVLEYPGYGARPGSPSEDALKSAAVDAVKLLLSQDQRPVYLIGESLGSGVASFVAAHFGDRVAGVLLVTPFSSLTDVAAHHYSFLPVKMLLQEEYNSVQALSHYHGPVAFLLAGDDEVVPAVLGQKLHDSHQGPKWLRIVPGAGHNSLPLHPGAGWWDEVSAFLREERRQPGAG